MGNGFIRITQLPEKDNIDGYLVIEDTNDTWKVKSDVYKNLINVYIQSFKNDINSLINDRISDFESVTNETESILSEIDKLIEQFNAQELIRQDNENDRIIEEEIRRNLFDEILNSSAIIENKEIERQKAELIRISNENKRIEAENTRVSNENTRGINETNRVKAENTRGINETNRVKAENTRVSNEQTRVNNENERIKNYKIHTDFFNNLTNSVNNYIKYGTSNLTTSSNQIIKVAEICIPNDNFYYNGLYHISCSSKESLIAISIQKDDTGYKYILGIPKRNKSFSSSDFNITYTTDNNSIIINIECNIKVTNQKITCSIIDDNISSFRPTDISQVYSTVLKYKDPISAFTTINKIPLNTINLNDSSQSFINLLNDIENQIKELIDAIKPYKMYPVGTIYSTTLTRNPADILGGGEWRMLYGMGIQETIYEDNTKQYSPAIYYWERIS